MARRSQFATEPDDDLDMMVGYCRVSTEDQDLSVQRKALERFGIPKDRIFFEKVSGAAKNLPERAKAIKLVKREGWTLVVMKLDRLGRSMRDVVNIAHSLDEVGAYIRTLDGVDTRNVMTGKLLLGMLAIVAEFERNMIASRTKSAMAYRKEQGAKFGQPVKMTKLKQAAIKMELRERDPNDKKRLLYTVKEVAKRNGVSVSSINRYFKDYRTGKMKKTNRGAQPRSATN